jgi:hypothetical protein
MDATKAEKFNDLSQPVGDFEFACDSVVNREIIALREGRAE